MAKNRICDFSDCLVYSDYFAEHILHPLPPLCAVANIALILLSLLFVFFFFRFPCFFLFMFFLAIGGGGRSRAPDLWVWPQLSFSPPSPPPLPGSFCDALGGGSPVQGGGRGGGPRSGTWGRPTSGGTREGLFFHLRAH